MLAKRLIKSNDAGGGCTNTVDLYNPFPDGGGVALYQLNGDATDVSGNHNGTPSAGLTYTTGQFDQAGLFENNTAFGSSSVDHITMDNITGTTSFSVSLWAKLNTIVEPNGGSFVSLISNTNSNYQIGLFAGGSTERFFRAGFAGDGTLGSQATYDFMLDNQWHHIVNVYTGGVNSKLYIDGVLVSTVASSSAQTMLINEISKSGNSKTGFNGSIDQVRIFNRVLRPYEVEALYTEEYCTPTIVPSEHFNTVLYAGNGSTQNITGVGFEPDLVWIKERTSTGWHILTDSVRGVNKTIYSNDTYQEESVTNIMNSFDANGFSVGYNASYSSVFSNKSNQDYVAWNFKAGGAAVTNTDGTITSQVSANTEAGFSVVGWTGNGSNNVTIGHGLESIPDMFIIKDRSVSKNWYIWQKDLAGDNYGLDFSTNAQATFSFGTVGAKTASTITAVAGGNGISNLNTNGNNYIGYFFSEIEGFSSIGSYVGNGGVNTIVTGFEPAFMLFRAVDIAFPWELVDNKRPDGELNANNSDAERIENTPDFLENGFRLTTERYNNAGQKFIYMAFAADPTTIEPTLEDSFNTVTYTGNGGTQAIGGVFEGGGSFNGSSSKIEIGNVVSRVSDTTDFSFSQWLNFSALPTSGGIMGIWGGSTPNLAAIRIAMVETSGQYRLDFLRNFNNTYYYSSSYPLISFTNNSWYNLVFTYVASTKTVKYFLNGSQVSEFNLDQSAALTTDANLTLGAYNTDHPARSYNGSIDQVRIFNTALTAEQVTELYEETDSDSHTLDYPSGAGAVALYELNGNANDTGGTYNGTASNVTWLHNGVGFQPDLVWFKKRSGTQVHNFYDSVRGVSKVLYSNLTNAEATVTSISSFDSNGFTLGNGGADTNASGQTYVAWNWKGAEIPAINSNGSITSVVSANPAAGFSIVSYTGTGNTVSFGHGLGKEPDCVIIKNRDRVVDWTVYFKVLGSSLKLRLSQSIAAAATGNYANTNPTNNVFTVSANDESGFLNEKYIAYCFAEVAGFSKFGSYTGNGVARTIALDFTPAFVMIKRTGTTGSWQIFDNKRSTYRLIPNDPTQELQTAGTNDEVTLVANGFTLPTDSGNGNNSALAGNTYIYMAFANQF